MAFPIGAHLKLTVNFQNTVAGARATSIFYYVVDTGPQPEIGSIAEVAEFFKSQVFDGFAPGLPIGIAITNVEAVWTAGSNQYDGISTSTGTTGSVSGDILPEEDCVVLQKRTGVAGRNKRGRWFIPYVPESFQAHGELNAAAKAAWLPICDSLRSPQVDAVGPTTWNPVLADSKTGTWVRIQDVRLVNQVCNKRGRRTPKRLDVSAISF